MLPANGWRPRDYQMPLWGALEQGCKRALAIWHRRAGKDEVILHRTACAAFERVGSYVHMLPLANQSRRAIWDAVNPHTGLRRIDEAFPHDLRETTREQDMFIRFINGSTWQVVGSDNFGSLIGSSLAGLVFSEFAMSDPAAWDYLRPILVENDGWAFFITTPRGRNHAARLYEYAASEDGRAAGWFAQKLTVADTGAVSEERIEAERRELASVRGDKEAKAIIDQEYFCDFDAALPGAYYGEHMVTAGREGRIGEFPWLPSLPVGIASDLGHGDQTVNWFYQQQPNGRIRIIDVLPGSGVGIDWYAKRITALPYTVVDTIWPHDGGHGNIRDVNGTNLTAQAAAHGWRPIRVLERDPTVDMGIQAVRQAFPLFEFNTQPLPHLKADGDMETMDEARTRMARAIDALRQYRREYDDKRQCFKGAPLHDWTSDFADGLRYLVRGRKPFPNVASSVPGYARPARAIMD